MGNQNNESSPPNKKSKKVCDVMEIDGGGILLPRLPSPCRQNSQEPEFEEEELEDDPYIKTSEDSIKHTPYPGCSLQESKSVNLEDSTLHAQSPASEDTKGPYVPMSVEELSVVTSLKHWTNNYVRVIGKIMSADNEIYFLHGVCEDQGTLCLNLDNIDQYPKLGTVVQVFGKLYEDRSLNYQNSQPTVSNPVPKIKLRVMFFTFPQDVASFIKLASVVKPYIPMFIRRDLQ